MLVDIKTIKLIIWDLDDTLWTGTLSEGGAQLSNEHKQLIVELLSKNDTCHKRLKQYKVLEEKSQVAKTFNSNEEFLYASNIQVTMHTDCMSNKERIHDLIMRSNLVVKQTKR